MRRERLGSIGMIREVFMPPGKIDSVMLGNAQVQTPP
jgi:hypothetical protein